MDKKRWFAWWETARGTGRPQTLRLEEAAVAPWVARRNYLPFASDDFAIVGGFEVEEVAWRQGMALVKIDSDGFFQWL